MKRLVLFLGRGGTVLIATGLALLLVSFIPSAQLTINGGSTAIPPKWVQSNFETILTPQEGLHITVEANGTLDVYILEVASAILYQWGDNNFLNVTDLEKFLDVNPGMIGWYDEVRSGVIRHEYLPTKVTNISLVFSNPSADYVPVNFEVSRTSSIAPGIKVQNLAQLAVLIGSFLFLPWLAQMWKSKALRKSP